MLRTRRGRTMNRCRCSVTVKVGTSGTIFRGIYYVHLLYKVTASLCVFICTLNLSNRQTDHDQIWHTYVNRSGNGSNLKNVPHWLGKAGLIGTTL